MDPPARQPGLFERKTKRRWTLPICAFSIAIVELLFYCMVAGLFSLGLTVFHDVTKKNGEEEELLRSGVIAFAGVYILLSIVLLIGTVKKYRSLLVLWMVLVVLFMVMEWICVVISVAIFLNGSLFFISGSYGPLRIYFVCLIGLYAQRLKFVKQNGQTVPVVMTKKTSADGYSVVHNAIFTQAISDSEIEGEEPVKVTFEIKGTASEQSLI